jgi:hypothetical protein
VRKSQHIDGRVCTRVSLLAKHPKRNHAHTRTNNREANIQSLAQLQKRVAQMVHVDLYHIRKVKQHVRRLLLSADDIEARSHHLLGAAALHKIVLDSKLKVLVGRIDVVLIQAQHGCNVGDAPSAVGERHFARVTAKPVMQTGAE